MPNSLKIVICQVKLPPPQKKRKKNVKIILDDEYFANDTEAENYFCFSLHPIDAGQPYEFIREAGGVKV